MARNSNQIINALARRHSAIKRSLQKSSKFEKETLIVDYQGATDESREVNKILHSFGKEARYQKQKAFRDVLRRMRHPVACKQCDLFATCEKRHKYNLRKCESGTTEKTNGI